MNKGAWTPEEDRKLAEYIEVHGPKRWKTVANKSGMLCFFFSFFLSLDFGYGVY